MEKHYIMCIALLLIIDLLTCGQAKAVYVGEGAFSPSGNSTIINGVYIIDRGWTPIGNDFENGELSYKNMLDVDNRTTTNREIPLSIAIQKPYLSIEVYIDDLRVDEDLEIVTKEEKETYDLLKVKVELKQNSKAVISVIVRYDGIGIKSKEKIEGKYFDLNGSVTNKYLYTFENKSNRFEIKDAEYMLREEVTGVTDIKDKALNEDSEIIDVSGTRCMLISIEKQEEEQFYVYMKETQEEKVVKETKYILLPLGAALLGIAIWIIYKRGEIIRVDKKSKRGRLGKNVVLNFREKR